MTKKIIHYLDAPCGSGKTTSIISYYEKQIRASGSRLVIAQPTIQLIESTAERFVDAGFKPVLITSEHSQEFDSAASHFKQALLDASIDLIITTHATLITNPNFEKAKKDSTYLVIDEIPSIESHWHKNLPLSRGYLADAFIANVYGYQPDYVRLERNPLSKRFKEIKSIKDDLYGIFAEIFNLVDNANLHVFCKQDNWELVTADEVEDKNQIHLNIVMDHSIFDKWANVCVMGANFLDSMMYKGWSQYVDFQPSNIAKLSAIHTESTGKRASIKYLFEQNWSKHLISQIPLEDVTKEINAYFEDRSYIYAMNNDTNRSIIEGFNSEYAEKAPVVSLGLNEFRHIHNAVFLPALNDTTNQIRFLNAYFGIEASEISNAKANEVAYQFALRTSLRVPDAVEPVEIIVADKRTAEFLSSKLPGSTVAMFGTAVAETLHPVKPNKLRALTEQEKKEKQRKTKKEIESVRNSLVPSNGMIDFAIYESIYVKTANITESYSMNDFSQMVIEASQETLARKEDGLLFQGSGVRSGSDFLANLIAIDIDSSGLDPRKIKEIIPYASIVSNTRSNVSGEGTYRYRVMVPLKAKVGDELFRYIAQRIKTDIIAYCATNNINKSGLDRTTPIGLYYLPAMPETGKSKDSFVFHNKWNEKSVLDPDLYVSDMVSEKITKEYDNKRRAELIAEMPIVAPANKQEIIEEARTVWASTSAGNGNASFFEYGKTLHWKGHLPIDEVEQILRRDFALSGSDSETRRKQIPSIVDWLRNKSNDYYSLNH